MVFPSEGSPFDPIIKILGTSTLAGTVVWLGYRIIPLNFQSGFLFSALSLITLKIASEINPIINARCRVPIIRGSIFCGIAFGIPIAIMHQMTPLDLMKAGYLTLVAVATRQVFRIVTDRNPFL
jgi:hypothetical protein